MNLNIIKTPIMYYSDIIKSKTIIYKNNRNKSGIYCWENKMTNQMYIGSAVNLSNRLANYFSIEKLKYDLARGNSRILPSLLKYGYSEFNLYILEYCEKERLIEREQFYMDLLKPEYNILKIAGSRFGSKHSESTLLKFKNRKHSLETIIKIKSAMKGYKSTSALRLKNQLLAESHPISIINEQTAEIKIYPSIRSAAREFKVSHVNLIYHISKNSLYKGIFSIKKL